VKKKIIFFVLFLVALFFIEEYLFTSFVPFKERPTEKEINELQSFIDIAPYDNNVYKPWLNDCSNQSAALFGFLSDKGYKCTLVVGARFDMVHVWLIARKNKKKFFIQAVDKKIGDASDFSSYFLRLHFNSLKTARFFSELIFFSYFNPFLSLICLTTFCCNAGGTCSNL